MIGAAPESSLGATCEAAVGAEKNDKKPVTVSASAPARENLRFFKVEFSSFRESFRRKDELGMRRRS
jgi:hypothetical protein